MEIRHKYLKGDSLQWLLDPVDPVIRYLALRDIMDQCSQGDYRSLESSSAVVSLLGKAKGSVMGDRKRFDLYHRGALWYFALGAALGLDTRTPLINNTAAFILGRSQVESGGFTLSWKPPVESALYSGEIVRLTLQTGIINDKVDRGIEWICSHQRHDGGWLYWPVGSSLDMLSFMFLNRPGRGGERDSDHNIPSCPYASLACARALMLYSRKVSSENITSSIEKAAEFFLGKRVFQFHYRPRYNSRLIANQDFMQLGYPVLGQYDILSALIFIAEAGRFDDHRAADAFNSVMAKQNERGIWQQESFMTGMMRPSDVLSSKKERNSKWITLQVMRLLKHLDR